MISLTVTTMQCASELKVAVVAVVVVLVIVVAVVADTRSNKGSGQSQRFSVYIYTGLPGDPAGEHLHPPAGRQCNGNVCLQRLLVGYTGSTDLGSQVWPSMCLAF